MKRNFDKIDILKFIFSICIIVLHTLLLTSFQNDMKKLQYIHYKRNNQ